MIPNKLSGGQYAALKAPLTVGLVALRLGRADSEHYHDLTYAVTLAATIAETVQRHRHLAGPLDKAIAALSAIFERAQQRTAKDAPWIGAPAEVDVIELGVEIYLGLLKTTPGKHLRRALSKTALTIQAAESQRTAA